MSHDKPILGYISKTYEKNAFNKGLNRMKILKFLQPFVAYRSL